eukprot:8256027-Pyramimonas_sp.AAC.1
MHRVGALGVRRVQGLARGTPGLPRAHLGPPWSPETGPTKGAPRRIQEGFGAQVDFSRGLLRDLLRDR